MARDPHGPGATPKARSGEPKFVAKSAMTAALSTGHRAASTTVSINAAFAMRTGQPGRQGCKSRFRLSTIILETSADLLFSDASSMHLTEMR
jgi:hypothetical protein